MKERENERTKCLFVNNDTCEHTTNTTGEGRTDEGGVGGDRGRGRRNDSESGSDDEGETGKKACKRQSQRGGGRMMMTESETEAENVTDKGVEGGRKGAREEGKEDIANGKGDRRGGGGEGGSEVKDARNLIREDNNKKDDMNTDMALDTDTEMDTDLYIINKRTDKQTEEANKVTDEVGLGVNSENEERGASGGRKMDEWVRSQREVQELQDNIQELAERWTGKSEDQSNSRGMEKVLKELGTCMVGMTKAMNTMGKAQEELRETQTNMHREMAFQAHTQSKTHDKIEHIMEKIEIRTDTVEKQQELFMEAITKLSNNAIRTNEDVKENKQAIEEVNRKQTNTERKIEQLEERLDRMGENLDKIESQSRRSNLKFHGIPEGRFGWGGMRENCERIIHDLVHEFMPGQWGPDMVDRAHRIGRFTGDRGKPRPIIAKMLRWGEAIKILGNREGRERMRREGITISQDYTQKQQDDLRRLKEQGHAAYYYRGRLYVKGENGQPRMVVERRREGRREGGSNQRPARFFRQGGEENGRYRQERQAAWMNENVRRDRDRDSRHGWMRKDEKEVREREMEREHGGVNKGSGDAYIERMEVRQRGKQEEGSLKDVLRRHESDERDGRGSDRDVGEQERKRERTNNDMRMEERKDEQGSEARYEYLKYGSNVERDRKYGTHQNDEKIDVYWDSGDDIDTGNEAQETTETEIHVLKSKLRAGDNLTSAEFLQMLDSWEKGMCMSERDSRQERRRLRKEGEHERMMGEREGGVEGGSVEEGKETNEREREREEGRVDGSEGGREKVIESERERERVRETEREKVDELQRNNTMQNDDDDVAGTDTNMDKREIHVERRGLVVGEIVEEHRGNRIRYEEGGEWIEGGAEKKESKGLNVTETREGGEGEGGSKDKDEKNEKGKEKENTTGLYSDKVRMPAKTAAAQRQDNQIESGQRPSANFGGARPKQPVPVKNKNVAAIGTTGKRSKGILGGEDDRRATFGQSKAIMKKATSDNSLEQSTLDQHFRGREDREGERGGGRKREVSEEKEDRQRDDSKETTRRLRSHSHSQGTEKGDR